MSDNWNQIQYRTITEPVSVPAPPAAIPDFGWYSQTNQPNFVREYRYLFPNNFSLGEPVATPVPIPDFAWYTQTGEPERAPEYRHLIPSTFGLGEPPAPPTPAPDFGWFTETNRPTRAVEFRHLLPAHFNPANWAVVIDTTDDDGVFFRGWVQPTNQPVRPVEYRHVLPTWFQQIEPDDFVAGASPATVQPLTAAIASSISDNNIVILTKTGNSTIPVRSRNSVTPL